VEEKEVVVYYTPEIFDALQKIEGVSSVEIETNSQVYLLREDLEGLETNNSNPFSYISATIKQIDSVDEKSIAQIPNSPDQLELYVFDFSKGFQSIAILKENYYITSSDSVHGSEDSLILSVSTEQFSELKLILPIKIIDLILSNESYEASAISELSEQFPIERFIITNLKEMYRHQLKTSSGYYILLIFLTIVLLLFIIIVVSSLMKEIINSNIALFCTLYQLGTSKKTLNRALMRLVMKFAALSVSVSAIPSLALYQWIAVLSDIPFSVNIILFHILVSSVVFIAYMLSAFCSLKQLKC
jgi:hypothetical protein